ncbi:MAG: hypothetical protein KGI73_00250 [Patescibacteria group bacterium]|nr:hypothetical protein [Patescibacteria group bacterium]
MHKKYEAVVAMGAVVAALGFMGPAIASAATTATTNYSVNQPAGANSEEFREVPGTERQRPGVFGTVTAISGSTLTVEQKAFAHPGTSNTASTATATTYTVDASNATVTKNGSTISLSTVAVGDTVMVQGTVNGTNVTATAIRDGIPAGGMHRGWGKGQQGGAPATIIQGNGEPIVGGSVSAISGTTLTVTNKSNITYSVDAANATVQKGNATSTVSAIVVGDNVIVQGTVNGTSITASSVIDSGAAPANGSASANGKAHGIFGFFQGLGGFFAHLFGF